MRVGTFNWKKNVIAALVIGTTLGVGLPAGLAPVAAKAAPVAANTAAQATSVNGVRFSNAPGKLRIVLDGNNIANFTDTAKDNKIIVDVDGINLSTQSVFQTNDALVKGWQLSEPVKGKTRLEITLARQAVYRVFSLQSPNRIVIDIIKDYREKVEYDFAPGIHYTSWREGMRAGPVWLHILSVDPTSGYMVRPVLAQDAIANGREALTDMVSRTGAVAAINASYFDTTGWIVGNLKMEGEIVSAEERLRTAFSYFGDGRRYQMGQVRYEGRLVLPNGATAGIGGVNRPRLDNEIVLYNQYYGASTGMKGGVEYLVKNGRVEVVNPKGDTALAPGGYVLSASGQAASLFAGVKPGQQLLIQGTLCGAEDKADYVLGAGPFLVRQGNIALTTTDEDFPADIAVGRAPRTAVGISKTGQILLVVVDGRQWNSIGLTLQELAEFMQSLGAQDAMNLDGGGSSELVLKGDIMNTPSDGRERPVASALAVFPTGSAR